MASNKPNDDASIAASSLASLSHDTQDIVYSDEELKFYGSGLFNIETSPAFKHLDTLKQKKEMDAESVTKYQLLIKSFYNNLTSTAEYERNLAKKLKQINQDIELLKLEKDKTISKQFSQNSDLAELRRELLKTQNEAELAREREYKINADVEDSRKQKNDLLKDIDEIRRHKADMLEPSLIATTKELKSDLIQRRHQVENLEKDYEEKVGTYDSFQQEVEKFENERERLSIALSKASEMPIKIAKQAEILQDAISDLNVENTKQTNLGTQMDKEIERLSKKKKDLEDLKAIELSNYERRRGEISQLERQVDDIFKEHEIAKEQLSIQKAEKVRLELALKRMDSDLRKAHDGVIKAIREKELQLKLFRRYTLSLNNVKMAIPAIKMQKKESERIYEGVLADEKYYKKELSELRKVIDIALMEYLNMEKLERTEGIKARESLARNQKTELEIEEFNLKAVEFGKEIEDLKVAKDLKVREVVRILLKVKALRDEKSVKDISIFDASKRTIEAQARLKDSTTLYEFVKNEKNKYLNQIQSASQKASEMREKIRILSNEMDILRQEIINRDRDLGKKRQETASAYAIRDAAKNEANKLLKLYKSKREMIDQNLTTIESLNMQINLAEEEMVSLKDRYEAAVKDRNSVGVHLLDRNDELCILYERLNIQQDIMKKGELQIQERDEEIKKFRLIALEITRAIEVKKNRIPECTKTTLKAKDLEKELLEMRKLVTELSKKMESPEDPSRCRYLKGKDLNRNELIQKIGNLENVLAVKEEKLLEKDLILEEVSTLTNRLRKQTLEGRAESNTSNLRLNDLTKRIKDVTKSMMAKVSELSMHQALSMNLYQEKSDKEIFIENIESRMQNGDLPVEFFERDLIRAEKMKRWRDKELQEIKDKNGRIDDSGKFVEYHDDGFYEYNGMRTMAEPRPNAYVPDLALTELPIPKPYGMHAPFKAQEHGSQMRFYKKPVIKPVKI